MCLGSGCGILQVKGHKRHLHRDKLTWTDNTCIYPDFVPIRELGPYPYIYLISPKHLQTGTTLPDYLRLGLVCMTLSHRINRTRNDPQCNVLAETFYWYRGLVIRSLNEDISVEHKCTGDIVIAGIITLLLADVS